MEVDECFNRMKPSGRKRRATSLTRVYVRGAAEEFSASPPTFVVSVGEA